MIHAFWWGILSLRKISQHNKYITKSCLGYSSCAETALLELPSIENQPALLFQDNGAPAISGLNSEAVGKSPRRKAFGKLVLFLLLELCP